MSRVPQSFSAVCVAVMGLIWRQFWALTWKNYIINRRKPITTCLLVFMPTLFPLIIVFYLKSGLMITAKDVESWLPEKLDLCFKHGNRMSLHCTSRMRRLTVYYSPDVQVTRDIMAYINKGLQHKLGKTATSNTLYPDCKYRH